MKENATIETSHTFPVKLEGNLGFNIEFRRNMLPEYI